MTRSKAAADHKPSIDPMPLNPAVPLPASAPVHHWLIRAVTQTLFAFIRIFLRKKTDGLPIEVPIIVKLTRLGGNPCKVSIGRLRWMYRMLTIPFQTHPPTMESVEEHKVSDELRLRIYRPHGLKNPAPAMLYFHGGGCIIGDLDTHDSFCRIVAKRAGIVIASAQYRLAPEDPFPAQIIDSRTICLWLCNNSHKLGLDPKRTGVGGDSAGGYLSLLLALSRIDTKPSPAFLALIYPFLDPTLSSPSSKIDDANLLLSKDLMERFMGLIATGNLDINSPAINPLKHPDIGNLPPIYVMTAEHDPLRDEGKALVKTIKSKGGHVTHRHEKRLFHEFISMGGVVKEARIAVETYADWIKKQVGS